MRSFGAKGTMCCCPSGTCRGIGYAHAGLLCLPSKQETRAAWYSSLGWSRSASDMSLPENVNPRGYSIAWWHFPPERRHQSNGKWSLIDRNAPYTDSDGKQWPCLVPINPLKGNRGFIDVEVRGVSTHPKNRWAEQVEPRPAWAPKVSVKAGIVGGTHTPRSGGGCGGRGGSAGKRKRSCSPSMVNPVASPEYRAVTEHGRAEELSQKNTTLEEQMRLMKEQNEETVRMLDAARAELLEKDAQIKEKDEMIGVLSTDLVKAEKRRKTFAV